MTMFVSDIIEAVFVAVDVICVVVPKRSSIFPSLRCLATDGFLMLLNCIVFE
jgi:hypothetical protein